MRKLFLILALAVFTQQLLSAQQALSLWKGRRPQRSFEISILPLEMTFSNTYISVSDLFKQLTDFLSRGKDFDFNPAAINSDFAAAMNANLQLFKIKTTNKYKTTFDFWTNVDSAFYFDLSGETMSAVQKIKDAVEDPSNLDFNSIHGSAFTAGYAYFEFGFGISKTADNERFYFRLAPQVYIPLVYAKKIQ